MIEDERVIQVNQVIILFCKQVISQSVSQSIKQSRTISSRNYPAAA
jgi:hypothetical protein